MCSLSVELPQLLLCLELGIFLSWRSALSFWRAWLRRATDHCFFMNRVIEIEGEVILKVILIKVIWQAACFAYERRQL